VDTTPQIEIIGGRIVYLDRCQVGHMSDEDGQWRLWFWPEYDYRAAYPVTGDLSFVLYDSEKLRAAIHAPLLRAVLRTPSMSYLTKFTRFSGVPRQPFDSYAGWLSRRKNLRDYRAFGTSIPPYF
jgi:hypothetical protein